MNYSFVFALLALAWLYAPSPAAAQDPSHVSEFRLFQEAQARGEFEVAAKHGFAAWRAAEDALGHHRNTAVLAYNFGLHVAYAYPGDALVAFRRANDLMIAGLAELPAEELALYLSYAEFKAGDDRLERANTLRGTLSNVDDASALASPDIGQIWLDLAEYELLTRQFQQARSSAQEAEEIFEAASGAINQKAKTLLVRGIAHLLPPERQVADLKIAHDLFRQAENLFPPQKDMDSFDPMLGQILAWQIAITSASVEMLDEFEDLEIGARLLDDGDGQGAAAPNLFEGPRSSMEACGIEWGEVYGAQYPPNAAILGNVGAVIVGYNLGDDLRPHDLRIIAEVPNAQFGDAVLAAMHLWRLKAPPPARPECRENRISYFNFSLEQ